ncbi:hypothetical protein [Streptomyces sp. NPDC059894]|uniref:hypothetical protein n=1 Tax=unclassified Streptomyces TaxID=2593676 RepID=UPI003668A072
MPSITGAGRTRSGQGWQKYEEGGGIYLDVDTSSAGFSASFDTPVYVLSLGGNGTHWTVTGSSAVYSPTHSGFRVYLKKIDPNDRLTVEKAQEWGFHINWVGVQNF